MSFEEKNSNPAQANSGSVQEGERGLIGSFL